MLVEAHLLLIDLCATTQCEPEVCAEMEAQYGRKPYVPEREAYRHRFLMVVDGNSFSSRHAPVCCRNVRVGIQTYEG